MKLIFAATALVTLIATHAVTYDPAKAPSYPSYDMYRPNADAIILNGDRSRGPVSGFSTAAPGGVYRTLMDRADDCVNVKDRGAKPDLVVDANGNYVSGTDNTAAFQAALNRALSQRKDVCVPGGAYYLAGGLTLDVSGQIADSNARPSIRGAGQSSTWLRFGNGWFNALAIKGSSNVAGPHAYLTLSGMRIEKTDVQGHGLDLNTVAYLKLTDLTINGFDIGINGIDWLSSTITSSNIGSNRVGIYAAKGSFSFPNALSIIDSHVSLNFQNAIIAKGPTTLSVQGGEIGVNGCSSADPNRGGVLIDGGPAEGGVSYVSHHVYYEVNCGAFDVGVFNNDGRAGTYVFEANTFNRVDSTRFVNSNIKLSGSTPMALVLQGNAFKKYNDYVASTARPYLDISGAPSVTLASTANWMDDPTIEGTNVAEWNDWLPTVTAASGSLGSVIINRARYRRVGKTAFVFLDFSIPANGTGSGALLTTLPVAPAAPSSPVLSGQVAQTGGPAVARWLGANAAIFNAANSYPGGDGARIVLSGSYEID